MSLVPQFHLGTGATSKGIRQWTSVGRSVRLWGLSIGWFFVGVATAPQDKPECPSTDKETP
jgi:hypothetical protein